MLRRITALVAALFALPILCAAATFNGAGEAPPPSPATPASELVLTVDLDGDPVLDGLLAFERGGRVFVPVCPLAEALSLAIHCTEHRAYGFVIDEARPFVIDLDGGYLVSERAVSPVGAAAYAEGGEIYFDVAELSKSLPVDLTVDREAAFLHVHPRELLPLQGFKKRQQQRKAAPVAPMKQRPQEYTSRPALASIPTIDLTSELQLARQGSVAKTQTRNALQITGDLLHLSAAAHLAADSDRFQRVDLSLSKRREAPFFIGPLPVTQLLLGAAQAPSVDGIGGNNTTMYGVSLSNRPINAASQFLSHDLDGYLPSGWDAELLHNGVPVGYQPPTEEGMYHFKNLRVQYGLNDFKVILHGPYGETRLSEQTFVTDSVTPKGEFLYTLYTAWQTGIAGEREPGTGEESNVTFSSDFGITEGLTGSASFVRETDFLGQEETYFGLGARTAFGYTLLSFDVLQRFASEEGEGQLFTVRSSGRYFSDIALESALRFFNNFSSPLFVKESDPLVARGTLKGSTSFDGWYGIRYPLSMQMTLDSRRSGRVDCGTTARISGGWNGWNSSLEGDLSYIEEELNASAVLQISTRVKELSIRGHAGFLLAPSASPSVINVSADEEVGGGFLLNSAFSHDVAGGVSALKIGVSKKMALLGYSLSATGDSTGAYSFNVAVSTSLAADRANAQVVLSSEPLSSYGMVAASAALAATPGAPAKDLSRIGFLVNGGRAITVTGSGGVPVIGYLQPDLPVDITVDLSTVEDPFMVPLEDGCHIIPRAGVVSACTFTMVTGGEIDGMVFIGLKNAAEVPVKGVQVSLLREGPRGRETVSTAVTEESGYYLFKAVKPGKYLLSVSEKDAARLRAETPPQITVTMPEGGDQVTGNDFRLKSGADGP